MIELYIKGKKVYFDDSKQIKLTEENPYFTLKGNYSLEIVIPMKIASNREVFGCIDRIEVSKKAEKMQAQLYEDNRILIDGYAKLVKITNDSVTIQLSGGASGNRFMEEHGEKYIDEIDIGAGDRNAFINWDPFYDPAIGKIGEYVYMPVYDETNGRRWNTISSRLEESGLTYTFSAWTPCVMPNLLYVIRNIIESLGYKIEKNPFDCPPWDHLYIANAHGTLSYNLALPHWKMSDFIKELQYFFNCTIEFNDERQEVSFLSNKTFFDADIQEYPTIDEYLSELKDDGDEENSMSSSNIRYDISDSSSHKYDVLSDEILDSIPIKEYASHEDTINNVNAMTDTEKNYIYIKMIPAIISGGRRLGMNLKYGFYNM